MRAARIALRALLVTPLVVAGALAYVSFSLEAHKEHLATGLGRALGQPVRIDGAVGLAWLPQPSLTLEEVEVGGAGGWADPPWRIGRLESELDLAALSNRELRIRRLLLRESLMHIGPGRSGGLGTSQPSVGPGGFRLGIDSVRVLESTLVVRSGQGQTRALRIERLDVQGLGGPDLILTGEGSESGVPLAISLSAGSPGEPGSPRWPFDARLRVADASLEASGSAAAPFDFARIEADLNFSGQDLQVLQGMVPGLALPAGAFRLTGRLNRVEGVLQLGAIEGVLDAAEPLGPIAVSDATLRHAAGALTADLEGRLRQTPFRLELGLHRTETEQPAPGCPRGRPRRLEIAGVLGETGLIGDLVLTSGDRRPRIEGDLAVERVDLRPPFPFRPSGAKAPATKAWLDVPLPVGSLKGLDLNLELRIQGLDAGRLQVGPIATRVTLADGLIRLDALSVAWPGMGLAGETTLDTRSGPPRVTAALQADRVTLPEAVAFLASPPGLSGRLEGVSLAAEAQGATARALLETLGGQLGAEEARLWAAASDRRDARETRLAQPRLTVEPGAPVRLQTAVQIAGQVLDLDLIGGSLADLPSQETGWPEIGVAARRSPATDGPEIRGRIGPLAAVLAGREIDLELSLQRPGLSIGAQGTLARLGALRGSTLAVEAAIEDHAVLGDLFADALGAPLRLGFSGGPPLTASARLVGLEHGLEVHDLRTVSGDSDLEGDLVIRPGPRPRIEATLRSRMLDLRPHLGGGAPAADGAGAAAGRGPPHELLQALEGTLRLTAGHLRANGFALEMLDLAAALDSGHLRASLAAGAERLSADIDLRPDDSGWRFDIQARGNLDLSWLLETDRATALSHLPTSLDAGFSGVAASFDTLLEHAGGHLDLALGPGRLNRRVADRLPLGGLVVGILDAVNPLDHRLDSRDLRCAVLRFDLADGIATSTQGLAVQTRDINAIGGGALNLRTGEIEIRFKTVRRRPGIGLLGIADRFVYVKGTLRSPQVGIDPGALLLHGAAAWATTGISLLADQLVRRLTATANPCDVVGGRR